MPLLFAPTHNKLMQSAMGGLRKRMESEMEASQATDFKVIGHHYQPIAYFDGAVLKYEGMACEMNRDRMMAKPGMIMMDSYKGDRIVAKDHSIY